MATIGLRVQDSADGGTSLSLADTLAKGIFGDPEGQMKARVLASQVQAHQAYATKLGADTGLVNVKTREEQALADAQDAAAKSPDALVAAVPQPVPVEASRPGLDAGGYGPQPGIVSPEAQRMHDAQVATLTKLWPVIVRSGNATQVIEALGKGEGLAGLSGGLVPGAKVDPNVQRVAGGLYTGTAPTTSTVWSPGDIAGQQAEAGKDIAVARAKPIKPDIKEIGGGLVTVDPTGATATPVQGAEPQPKAPERQVIDNQVWERGPDGKWAPAQGITALPKAPERQVVDGTVYERDPASGKWAPAAGIAPMPKAPERQVVDGTVYERGPDGKWAPATGIAPAPPKIINIGKNETPMVQGPDGALTVAPGFAPQDKGGPFSGSNSVEGIAYNTVLETASKLNSGAPISPDEARAYEATFKQLYGPQWTQKDVNGTLVWDLTPGRPPPSSLPPPEVILSKAGLPTVASAPAPAPVPGPSGTAPPAGTPPVAGPPSQSPPVQGQPVFTNAPSKPPTAEQAKDQIFAASLAEPLKYLDKLGANDVPDVFSSWLVAPASGKSSTLLRSIAETQVSPAAKQYGQAVAAWTSNMLYKLSGAAIGEGEFDRAMRGYLPRPGDTQDVLDAKKAQRHAFLDATVGAAYANDPAGKAKFIADFITKSPNNAASTNTASPGPEDVPPKNYPGTPAGWKHMSPEDRKLFQ